MNKFFYESHSQALRRLRLDDLSQYLASVRTADASDVTFVCGNRKFFAHRLILQSCSKYFKTMFESRSKDDEMGKVVLKDVEPETFSAILDYVYLGEVKRLTTADFVIKVLAASQLMALGELMDYCFHVLEDIISVKNYLELWEIGMKYKNAGLSLKIMGFLLAFFNYVTEDDTLFARWSPYQIREFLWFCKDNPQVDCLDKIFRGILKWVLHDVICREKFAAELLTCINLKMISTECMTSLLKDNDVMKSSVELTNQMNALGVAFFLQGSSIDKEQPLLRNDATWPFSILTESVTTNASTVNPLPDLTTLLLEENDDEYIDGE